MSPALLLVALVAWSGGDGTKTGAPPRPEGSEEPRQDLEQGSESELLERFNRCLQGFRSGVDDQLPELRRLTSTLEERFGRTDVGSTARHFLALSREERMQGVERLARFEELRGELVRAGREGVADWPALRARVLAELRALEDECLLAPDPTPAGHAAAQRAYLLVEWAAVQPDAGQRTALEGQATEAAERSLRAFRRAGQRTPTLLPRWVLGRLARARLDRAAANAQFRACVEIATEVGQPEWRERGLLGLVSLARDAGSLREVERLLAELRSFRGWLESWPLRRELALLDLSRDQPALALDQLGPLPDEPRARAEGLRIQTAALTRSGRLEDAAAALAKLEQLVGRSDASLVLAAAHLEAGRGAWEEALGRLAELSSAASAAAQTQAAALEGLCALRLGDSARADRALTRARESAAAWQRSHYEANGSVTGEWLGVQALVWGAQARLELGRPLEALALLERQGQDSLRRDAREPDLVAWARHFERGVLSLTLGADDGLAVHLSPQGEVTSAPLPHGRAEVTRAVERLLQAAWDRDDERVARLGAELGDALLPAPVREPLRRFAPDERLLVVLHGTLEALPIHLLRVEGRWLDEGLVPVVLPALPARAPGVRPSLSGAGWSLLGSPLLGGSGHPPLPEARAELEHVRSTLGGQHRVDTGAAFTRSALLQALNRRQPLHLATHLVADAACDHGVLSPTGIVTTDGVLCAGEVLAQEPALPLAVLNACGTARGVVVDGEGLMGLARAFLMGGTRNVLATLWPIEDRAARLGIETFHALLAEGRRPSEAAAGARRGLRERGFPAADWAALRLLGRD